MDKIETAKKAYALAYKIEQKYGDCPHQLMIQITTTALERL